MQDRCEHSTAIGAFAVVFSAENSNRFENDYKRL